MALWICTACTCQYSVGAPRCPHCGGTEYVEEGAAEMAKITVHGGPSNAAAEETVDEGGEEPSPESDSSTSDETPSGEPAPSEKPARPAARKTTSRAKKDTE